MTCQVTALWLLCLALFLLFNLSSVLKYSAPLRLRKWALVLSSDHHAGLFRKWEWIERSVTRCCRIAHISQICRSHLKILRARIVTWNKLHTKNPQMLGATIQNLVAMATWHSGYVHPCSTLGWYMWLCPGGGLILIMSTVVSVEQRRNLE